MKKFYQPPFFSCIVPWSPTIAQIDPEQASAPPYKGKTACNAPDHSGIGPVNQGNRLWFMEMA
jgi:hypothetical protein